MRIAFFYPHIHGSDGYPRDIRRLLEEIGKGGWAETVAIPQRVIAHGRSGVVTGELARMVELGSQLKHVDIVHFWGFFFPFYPLLARVVRARKVPYLVSPLGNLLPFALAKGHGKKQLFLKFMGKSFLQNAAAVHVFTDCEADSGRALGISTPIVRDPLGLYPEDIPDNLDALRPCVEEGYFLCFARLDIYQKGIDVLLEAFTRYVHQYSGKRRLVIAGRSWKNSHAYITERLKSLELEKQVSFLGEVSQEVKYSLMKHCHALIYPTRYDGPPRPIREALVLRKRILITHQANICNDIQSLGWGYQFEPTATELCDAIRKLEAEGEPPPYVDPLTILSWSKIASQMAETYRNFCSNGTRSDVGEIAR